jgi:hypothetical protein
MTVQKIKKGDKVYLSKYALTGGIQIEVATEDEGEDRMIALDSYGRFVYFRVGRDVFLSDRQAIDSAEVRRGKKIKSLEKSLAEMKSLRFFAPTIKPDIFEMTYEVVPEDMGEENE